MVRDAGSPICPQCGSDAHVFKLSQVYVAGITEVADRSAADEELLIELFGHAGSPTELAPLLRNFAPPAVPVRGMPRLRPGLLMLGFSLAVGLVAYILYNSLPGLFWPVVVMSGGLAVFFLILRGLIVRRIHLARQAVEADKMATGKLFDRWLQVYYCSRDGCVFDPRRGDIAPLDNSQKFLLM